MQKDGCGDVHRCARCSRYVSDGWDEVGVSWESFNREDGRCWRQEIASIVAAGVPARSLDAAIRDRDRTSRWHRDPEKRRPSCFV